VIIGLCRTKFVNFIGSWARRRWKRRFSKRPSNTPQVKKTTAAAAVAAEGRFPMKTVAEVIGVSRSNPADRLQERCKKRIGRPPLPDDELVSKIKAVIAELATYGDVVPQPGWLRVLLKPFNNPEVHLVGGQSHLAMNSTLAKTFALSWFFPLRQAEATLTPKAQFFANNFAFRRHVLLEHPFPALPGISRGQGSVLARKLFDLATPAYITTAAEVEHPPPSG
jgi:hypothetical protein